MVMCFFLFFLMGNENSLFNKKNNKFNFVIIKKNPRNYILSMLGKLSEMFTEFFSFSEWKKKVANWFEYLERNYDPRDDFTRYVQSLESQKEMETDVSDDDSSLDENSVSSSVTLHCAHENYSITSDSADENYSMTSHSADENSSDCVEIDSLRQQTEPEEYELECNDDDYTLYSYDSNFVNISSGECQESKYPFDSYRAYGHPFDSCNLMN